MKDILTKINHENFSRNNILIDSTHEYKIFSEEYLENVVQVFTQTFCNSEPMTHCLHMDAEKYKKFAYAVAKKAIEDKLSVIALHHNEVVAFALVEDLATPVDLPDFDPKFNFILGLLDTLGKNYFQNKKFPPKYIGHLFITAVAENHRQKKLSTQVNFQAMDLAAYYGFDFMYCEFTNFINEKGTIPHLSNKKKLIGSQLYKEFLIDHKKPFDTLEYGANSYLWEIRKEARLKYKSENKIIEERLF